MATHDTPEISVLIPAFDAGRALDACLRSVARQTRADWECVIVDDGSADGTAQRVQRFCDTDSRFRLVRRDHAGLVASLNAGIARCRGRLVARMDADDVMHSRRLAEQAAMLDADPSLAAVGCHVRTFPRERMTAGARAYEAWLNALRTAEDVRRDAFIECPVAHPSLMIRRERLSALGYRSAGWPEDYDLLLRLITSGERVGILPARRLCWRDHRRRLSRTSPTYDVLRFTECKAAFLAASFLARGPDYILWGYGGTGKALRRALATHDKRPTHIVELHPGRLGNRIHGAAVIPPDELPNVARSPLLVSVAGQGPRDISRSALESMGFQEIRDFICTA